MSESESANEQQRRVGREKEGVKSEVGKKRVQRGEPN